MNGNCCNNFTSSWPGMTVEGIALQHSVRPRGSGDPEQRVANFEVVGLDSRLRGNERKLLQQLYSVMAGHDGGRHCTSTLRSSPRKRGPRAASCELRSSRPGFPLARE